MSLIKEYFELIKDYQKKYGNKIILLMQVGSFFEVYSTSTDEIYMVDFSSLCDLKIANKSLSNKKIFMAGFRDYILDKYIEKIVSKSDYTVVVYNQTEEHNKIVRKEYGIYSKSTLFLDNDEHLSNNITCLWIHKTKRMFSENYIFGISTLDNYTGKVSINEYIIPYYHNPTTYDCIEKYISIYNPTELIIIHSLEDTVIRNIIQYINYKNKVIPININEETSLSSSVNKCEKQSYQEETMNRFYPHLQDNIMKSELCEQVISFQSLCFLLNYVEQHNPCLTKKIHEPIYEKNEDKVILANHSLKQLNIINNDTVKDNKYSSVLSMLNMCKTKMGCRSFNDLLVNPTKNIESLNRSYEITDYILQQKYDWSLELSKIKDIEKISRKIILNKCTPYDYFCLYNSCIILESICKTMDEKMLNYIDYENVSISIQLIKDSIYSFFDVSIIEGINTLSFDKYCDISDKIILKGNDKKLDLMIKKKVESNDILEAFIVYIQKEYNKVDTKNKTNVIKIHETVNSISLHITKRRSQNLKKIINSLDDSIELVYKSSYTNQNETTTFNISDIQFKEYNSTTNIIDCVFINTLTKQIRSECNEYYKYLFSVYCSFYSKIDITHINTLIRSIKTIDILNCKSLIVKEYNLSKPIIKEHTNSFFNIQEIFHPLIEKLETNEMYVKNNVSLGKEENGILLFGTNAVGKTSLIKSIGIAILMAQCGLYVPCSNMEYYPYEYIFTRIIGNDNIFKGLSTFAVEMSELRVILKYCNKNSLILGDELCSGTEVDSALSIFVSGLEKMYKENSSFIFATHFHQIQYFDEIKEMDKIKLKHLCVEYNKHLNTLVYNRKLQEGAGESIYGLEVCKSLSLPDSFLDRAYEIRSKYDNSYHNILTMKESSYNKDKLRNMCEFCNNTLGTEIHHLKYQKDFENKKESNHKGNLSSICEDCHNKIHSFGLVYEKKKTLDGYKIILKKDKN